MNTFTRIIHRILAPLRSAILVAGIALPLAACQEPTVIELDELDDFAAEPAVDFGRAYEIGRNALEGFDAGDYETFSRDWDDSLRKGIGPKDFEAFREAFIDEHGAFEYIYEVDLVDGANEGIVNYLFTARFAQGDAVMRLAFADDGSSVLGVQLGE